jgi:hypothetical protein
MANTQAQEQVTLEFVIKEAHGQFSKTMLSTRTKVILIGGFKDEATAIKAYLARARPNVDRRKNLSDDDAQYVRAVEQYAESARKYVEWIRNDGGHAIWREALVAYCTAFENCLKAIALALYLLEQRPKEGLSSQILVPSSELSAARRIISKRWSEEDFEIPRVRRFFEHYLTTPTSDRFFPGVTKPIDDSIWDICSAAFQVRNALVHNLGFMPQTVQLGEVTLHASWEVELTQTALKSVAEAFDRVLQPFGTDGFLLIL